MQVIELSHVVRLLVEEFGSCLRGIYGFTLSSIYIVVSIFFSIIPI